MRHSTYFDWRKEWTKAMETGTAPCRCCGDPAKRMKLLGKNTGCYCHVCYGEVVNGAMPNVTSPRHWRRIQDRG